MKRKKEKDRERAEKKERSKKGLSRFLLPTYCCAYYYYYYYYYSYYYYYTSNSLNEFKSMNEKRKVVDPFTSFGGLILN